MQNRPESNTEEYKRWRNAVFERDDYTCQMPGCGAQRLGKSMFSTVRRKGSKAVEAHHIQRWADAPMLRYIVSNGITLCKACHKKTKRMEVFYAPLFTSIVQSKK